MSFYQFSDGRVFEFNHEPQGAIKLTNKAGKAAVMKQAREDLRDLLPPGSTVNVILRHCSRSGMMRHLSLVVSANNELRDISNLAAEACGFSQTDNGYLKIGGCGMDMGFHAVYTLGRACYPDGFKLAANQCGRNGDKSGFDRDGGYAFNHRWV